MALCVMNGMALAWDLVGWLNFGWLVGTLALTFLIENWVTLTESESEK
jgi:hypothetical protein